MPNVKIYTTPFCAYCKMAKEFFKKNNVRYEEIDVTDNAKAQEEMIQKSHQLGVPVIDVGGQIVVGFDRQTLVGLLGVK